MNPATVLIAIGGLADDSGGPTRSTTLLAGELVACGWRVGVLTRAHLCPRALPAGVELLPVACQSGLWPRERGRVAQRARAWLEATSAVLHVNGLWDPFLHAAASARLASTPLVISPRGMLEPAALRRRRLKKAVAWWLYQRRLLATASVIHATSAVEQASVRRLLPHAPIVVVPNPVSFADPPPPPPLSARRRAICVSRLHPHKRLGDLITAFARLRPAGWELVLVGPDSDGHRAQLEQLAAALRSGDIVTFRGAVPPESVPAELAAAELFVLPSPSENFGMAIAEALAAGKPVIVTDGTPWREVDSRGCGWCVPPGVEPLSAALATATAQPPEVLAQMGARGVASIRATLDARTVAQQMAELYGSLRRRDTRA